MATKEKPKPLWAIEVFDGVNWRRMNVRYRDRVTARSWIPFVKAAWYARHARTVDVTKDVPAAS